MENWAKIVIGDSRKMLEVEDDSVQLVVTSPPYWSIKNYGTENQIGYGQTLHEYLKDLYRVWKESYRVLEPGRRLVINIGDQFARSIIYGRYKIIPLHAEIIAQCEEIGFDYMGSIIWQKKTTMNTTGGANVMGSYPYPPNGMVEIDYEYILIFKKPGKSRKVPKEIKEKSKLTKEEWKEFFSGHWYFGGVRQIEHQAMFPEELPNRVIRMFSFVGETVLDPFLGSGTTAKVALELNRNVIGYEINEDFLQVIRKKLGMDNLDLFSRRIEVIKRKSQIVPEIVDYVPRIQDAKPLIEPDKLRFNKNNLYRVVDILEDGKLKLDSGLTVKLRGIVITDLKRAIKYLKEYVLKKKVYLKFDKNYVANEDFLEAYVYLKNRIFINAQLIKLGTATTERHINFDFKTKFLKLEKENLKLCSEDLGGI
ncbi:DNA modification methylase [Balnearium lithotrophicum]|uniref:Methyltransferase n=1 Tax=Balnearium lithotrophicum TaxID=223788 RepID=A0A521CVI4_9BACT|nr:DNA methyltransferase [Balnearium lithotrophicum]SMO63422.1 DNA modification methylase [Balnearium lithotrophicum]